MTIGTGQSPVAAGLWESGKTSYRRFAVRMARASAWLRPVKAWFARQPLVRFVSASLWRRIIISNLLGLLILLGGILYLSQYHGWLIDAKRESLEAQGKIIAAAIAANATVDSGPVVLDPDKLPEVEGSLIPFRDDGFAALELSIKPERINPVLRRLVPPNSTRARVYGRDGTLIADTAMLLSRGQLVKPEANNAQPKTKNFWTRLTHWLIDKELPVYREIGTAKGTAYPEVQMALGGATTAMLLLTNKGEQIVSMAVPIKRARAVQGVLLLSTRPGEIDEVLSEERSFILTLAAAALLATIATSLLLARTVAGPMRRLSAAANHVSRDITARQDLPDYAERTDEVGQMARAFGAMTAALYRRIEASENFAADVAHELKNPLTAARSTAESLAYAKTDEQREQLVQQIKGELQRLNRLITDVANASRLNAELARQQMQPIDVTHVAKNVAAIFKDILSGEKRHVAIDVAPEPFAGAYVVSGHEGRLAQVMTNLVDNALSFSPENGTVTVKARAAGGSVEIAVEDEGPGIPPDRLEIIFDRFYTDRPTTEAVRGKNSGLGLSISKEIMEAHNGAIWAENRTNADGARCGARFVIRLPGIATARPGGAGARRG